jgi:hypothetical protein
MNTSQLPSISAAATVLAGAALAAEPPAVKDLIDKVSSPDDKIRGPAWQGAGPVGAPAIGALADLMMHTNFEIARCARRAIERIVRHAGRPGANSERQAVAAELLKLVQHRSVEVRRHALWMLSEIGDDASVPTMALALGDAEVREAARCALERIPGAPASAALRQALGSGPEAFQEAVAHSLRVRGEKVEGHPSKKLVPTKSTSVKAS